MDKHINTKNLVCFLLFFKKWPLFRPKSTSFQRYMFANEILGNLNLEFWRNEHLHRKTINLKVKADV